jgi:hypothetical protein
VRLIGGTKLILLEYILKKTRRKAEACRLCRFIMTMVQYIHTRDQQQHTHTAEQWWARFYAKPGYPELVATAPLPAVTPASWRGGSRCWFFLGLVEKGLDRGPPEAGFSLAKLPTGR